jgi:Sec-independent protein translocase protein TatA
VIAFLGPWQLLILSVVLVLIFGSRRVVQTLRALKAGGREFKRGLRGKGELPPPGD